MKKRKEIDAHALIRSIGEKNNIRAAKKLVAMYTPLINKTCGTIYRRYNKLVSMPELLAMARHLIVYLAVVEYDPNGKAHLPYFLKTHLHAKLVQIYRPTVSYRAHTTELSPTVKNQVGPYEKMYKNERSDVINAMNKFLFDKFNDRETDIVKEYIINGTPRAHLAVKYGISLNRMKIIQKRAMKKLRIFLNKRGIKSIKDI